MWMRFKEFDRDGDGFIGVSDMRQAMAALMGEELDDEMAAEMIREADMDGDGQLNYEEFCMMMGLM